MSTEISTALLTYNRCKEQFYFYQDCIYEECIRGMRSQDGKVHFADKKRTQMLEERVFKYRQKVIRIWNDYPELFI